MSVLLDSRNFYKDTIPIKYFSSYTNVKCCFHTQALLKSKSGKKELLLGLNKNEGSYFLVYSIPGYDLGDSLISKKQFLYGLEYFLGSELVPYFDIIFSAYKHLNDHAYSGRFRDTLERVTSDILFNCPVQRFAEG